jgi:hypothetical protein
VPEIEGAQGLVLRWRIAEGSAKNRSHSVRLYGASLGTYARSHMADLSSTNKLRRNLFDSESVNFTALSEIFRPKKVSNVQRLSISNNAISRNQRTVLHHTLN